MGIRADCEWYAHIWGSKMCVLRNKSESLVIQREKLSAFSPALSCHRTLRRKFQQRIKKREQVENCNQRVQMELNCWFVYYLNSSQFTTFTSTRKTVTHLPKTLTYIARTLVLFSFLRVHLFVCNRKISSDFKRRFYGFICAPHSTARSPKKFSLTQTTQKKCSLNINSCIHQKVSHENGSELPLFSTFSLVFDFPANFQGLETFHWEMEERTNWVVYQCIQCESKIYDVIN